MLPLKRRQILCLIPWLCLTLVHAHVCKAQFSDDFSDGDFTVNPVWSGDAGKFSINANRLQLTAPASTDKAYLSTPSLAINDATWEFLVTIVGSTSGSNYADVYLTSDGANLSGSLNGYFVRIGGTDDEVSLFEQTGTVKTNKIIDGLNGRVNQTAASIKIKVIRDENGFWQLFSDTDASGYVLEGNPTTNVKHLSSSYFGVYCYYSSTRSNDYSFDDFIVTGDPYTDPSQPAEYKDVIISEIFADPSPVIGLPEAEFIELYNRSEKIIDLGGWKFTDGSSTAILSGLLYPSEYRIITPTTSATLFSSFGAVLGVANFPTLNNTGDNLVLRRKDELVIDQVFYTDSWYRDDDKKQGGYTLELIDPANPCGENDNWIASDSPTGGTPGTQNSVFESKPDLTGPKLISVFPLSATTLRVSFNEKLEALLPATSNFILSPVISVSNVSFENTTLRSFIITLNAPLVVGTLYVLNATHVFDCNGNKIGTDFSTAEFALPEQAEEKDVVLNEILFNPRPTGVDFVEVYNNSTKYINLKNWSIANYVNDQVLNPKTITTEDVLIKPHAHLAFTTKTDIVKGEYVGAKTENIFTVSSMPSFNDGAGSVAILDQHNTVIDFFSYTDDLHSPFLKNKEGVSLERISVTALTNDVANWQSASSTVGFATPGYRNSNARSESLADKVKVEPEIFEPITGQPAFTQIHYNFNSTGLVANVKVFDFHGREIKTLANNATLGTTGFFRWDGDTENGTKARTGYYVLWMEVFNNSGKVESIRKRIVVAARNN